MKKDIRKRLGIYSMTAGAIALGVQEGKAQIVYNNFTDISITSAGGAADSLDLNGDGINDFGVKYINTGTANLLYIVPKLNNAVLTGTTPVRVTQLNVNDQINASPAAGQSWYSTSAVMLNTGGVDKYVGMKVTKGVNVYYGWMRFNVQNNNILIQDAAYNSTSQGSILAGQTVLGNIDPKIAQGTIIFVNASREICIRRENDAVNENGTVDVLNMNGKVIASTSLKGIETLIPVSNEIDGLYIVRVSYDTGTVSKKTTLR